ncbi:MAG: glycosyltransferase [Acidobacteria bacterium]|nr:glycosyltransferase [Acidobacteriota bacterium]
MDRIHILFLIDVLYGTQGGAEGVLWKMTNLLPKERYRCSIATFATYADLVASDSFPCKVHRFPIKRTYDLPALRTAFRLSKLIRSEGVSIVHTFFAASDLFGGLIARLSGCPVVISSRRDMGYQRTALHRVAYRLAGGLFDQVHAVGEQVRLQHIRQDGLEPGKVITLHNGVDLDAIDRVVKGSQLRQTAGDTASHVVICVANIRPVKAMDVLVETADRVRRVLPGVRFAVAGAIQDEEYMRRVTDLAGRLNVARHVDFLGQRADVVSMLKESDLFFLPSRSEGLSNAMLEAMACRLPCVATDVGGNKELVADGRSGYVFPDGDSVTAAQGIIRILTDRAAAASMGRAGRRLVEEHFTVQAMIHKLTGLYEDLVARNSACVQHRGPEEEIRDLMDTAR